jgi:predicted GIY-YIG superfamily endonuclease
MKWVYILKCEEEYYYVGQTSRLFRRFWEHNGGGGSLNTALYKPEGIVAIYKVNTLGKFFQYNRNVIDATNKEEHYNKWFLKYFNNDTNEEYDHLEAENNITECFMINNKENWTQIRGGKYIRFDIKYKFPENNFIKDLPICKCGLPCDIRKNEEKNLLFFRCAKKNMWDDFKELFDIEAEPCDFFMEYTKDKQFRLEEINNFENRRKILKDLFRKSDWLKNVEEEEEDDVEQCVSCNKYVWCDSEGNFKNNGIEYHNKRLLLCFDCFIDKNDDLSKKYYIPYEPKCLLKINKSIP